MKIRLSIRGKVLLLAAVNAALLAGTAVWFVRIQLANDVGSLLLGQSRQRINAVTQEIGYQLPRTPVKDRDALLARFSETYGVTFYLFHNFTIAQIAGPRVSLPQQVVQEMKKLRTRAPVSDKVLSLSVGEDGAKPLGGIPSAWRRPDMLLGVTQEPPFLTAAEPGYWVGMRVPLRSLDEPGAQPGVLLMMSSHFFTTPFFFDSRPWLTMAGVALVIALICWLPMVSRVTSSIARIAGATATIAKGKFQTKVQVKRSDELGDLGESINRMAGQLEGYVHGQKRFLRDAAHELRSPLARMQAALGNILETEMGPETEVLIEDLRQEIDLMSSLTGELLTFAREEGQQGKLKVGPVKLVDAVGRVMATENPGGQADVRVQVDSDLIVNAHADSLFRGLSNVIRNAIRYAGDAGPIALSATCHNGATIVTVTDHGPGIPEDFLEMVFTPFFRLDVSRDRKTGGNGLGMAIARSCIETCGGTIFCRNVNPGLQVTITLQTA